MNDLNWKDKNKLSWRMKVLNAQIPFEESFFRDKHNFPYESHKEGLKSFIRSMNWVRADYGMTGEGFKNINQLIETILEEEITSRSSITNLIFLPGSVTATTVDLRKGGECPDMGRITSNVLTKWICPWLTTIKTLRSLDLSDNDIDLESADLFNASLMARVCPLEKLNISSNKLRDSYVISVCEGLLRNPNFVFLRVLYLSNTGLSSMQGIVAIAKLISTSSLEEIDLSKNSLSAAEIKGLWNSVAHSKTLKLINLSENKIDDAGSEYVASMILYSTTLHFFSLYGNNIRSSGFIPILKALSVNSSLHSLILSPDVLSEESAVMLRWVLPTNTALRRICFVAPEEVNFKKLLTPSARYNILQSFLRNKSVGFYSFKKPDGDWVENGSVPSSSSFSFLGEPHETMHYASSRQQEYNIDTESKIDNLRDHYASINNISWTLPSISSSSFNRLSEFTGKISLENIFIHPPDLHFSIQQCAKFGQLRKLCVINSAVTSISALSALTRLEFLDLSGNSNVQFDCDQILNRIQTLRAANCNFSTWPQFQSSSLITLNMGGNPIKDIPNISLLPNIQNIYAHYCPFLAEIQKQNLKDFSSRDPFVLCLYIKRQQQQIQIVKNSLSVWGDDANVLVSLLHNNFYNFTGPMKSIIAKPNIFSVLCYRLKNVKPLLSLDVDINGVGDSNDSPLRTAYEMEKFELFYEILMYDKHQAKMSFRIGDSAKGGQNFISFWTAIFQKYSQLINQLLLRDAKTFFDFLIRVYQCDAPMTDQSLLDFGGIDTKNKNLAISSSSSSTTSSITLDRMIDILCADAYAITKSLNHMGSWELLLTRPDDFHNHFLKVNSIDFLKICLNTAEQYGIDITQLANSKTRDNRVLIHVALPEYGSVIQEHIRFFNNYDIDMDGPLHKSATCIVVAATDYTLKSKGAQRVALKLMHNKNQFELERKGREFLSAATSSDNNISPIVEIIRVHEGLEFEKASKNRFCSPSGSEGNICYYPYCIVMPLADKTLADILTHERIAGKEGDMDKIRIYARDLAQCLKKLHDKGRVIHGDVKPLNIVRVNNKLSLIDLDACASIRDHVGVVKVGEKYSSGYVPPEMIDCTEDANVLAIEATKAVDVWGFGVVLYHLLAGESLWKTDQQDNISTAEVRFQLKHWLNEKHKKMAILPPGIDMTAYNLLSHCLMADPSRRFADFSQILSHPFLSGNTLERMYGQGCKFSYFQSYRADTDYGKSKSLFEYAVATKEFQVFWDSTCLVGGEEWDIGFSRGLLQSDVFVPILSEKGLKKMCTLNKESDQDNLLLEMRLALEFAHPSRNFIKNFYPVFMYENMLVDNLHLSTDLVDSIEEKVKDILKRLHLGEPLRPAESPRATFEQIKKIAKDYHVVKGDAAQDLKETVLTDADLIEIVTKIRSLTQVKYSYYQSYHTVYDSGKSKVLLEQAQQMLFMNPYARTDRSAFSWDTLLLCDYFVPIITPAALESMSVSLSAAPSSSSSSSTSSSSTIPEADMNMIVEIRLALELFKRYPQYIKKIFPIIVEDVFNIDGEKNSTVWLLGSNLCDTVNDAVEKRIEEVLLSYKITPSKPQRAKESLKQTWKEISKIQGLIVRQKEQGEIVYRGEDDLNDYYKNAIIKKIAYLVGGSVFDESITKQQFDMVMEEKEKEREEKEKAVQEKEKAWEIISLLQEQLRNLSSEGNK